MIHHWIGQGKLTHLSSARASYPGGIRLILIMIAVSQSLND
jgi:hypothetical protein